MANRTAWVAGNGQALTWGTLINSANMASLASGSSVLSSVADIANGTNLDMFMDISYQLVIASSTIASGANFAFWIAVLNQDATHYGDGQFTSGTQSTSVPSWIPATIVPVPAIATTTNMWGTATGILIPPQSFRVLIQNNSGFALTAGTQTVQYKTYNINLNN